MHGTDSKIAGTLLVIFFKCLGMAWFFLFLNDQLQFYILLDVGSTQDMPSLTSPLPVIHQGPGAPLFVRAVSARFGEGMTGLLQELRLVLQGRHQILG